jgi:hypothetical protein
LRLGGNSSGGQKTPWSALKNFVPSGEDGIICPFFAVQRFRLFVVYGNNVPNSHLLSFGRSWARADLVPSLRTATFDAFVSRW